MAIGGERTGVIDLEVVGQLAEDHLPHPIAEHLLVHDQIEPLNTSRDYRMDYREKLDEAIDAPEPAPIRVEPSEIKSTL